MLMDVVVRLGVVRKLRHALEGEGVGDRPNTNFFFLWKICDMGGEGGLEKVVFLRDVIYERPLIRIILGRVYCLRGIALLGLLQGYKLWVG